MFKKILLTTAALVAATGIAFSAGIYQGLPIVGGASYCASTENGNCVSTIPAGPTTITGNELIAADTGLPQGIQPQTVALQLRAIGAGPAQYVVATTGQSITVNPLASELILDPAGTIAALTVVLPASTALMDGQALEIGSSNTITALTITPGAGTTVAQSPTALTVSTTTSYGYKLQYVASAAKWIRLQ